MAMKVVLFSAAAKIEPSVTGAEHMVKMIGYMRKAGW